MTAPSETVSIGLSSIHEQRDILYHANYTCRVCSKDGCTPLSDKIEDEYDIMCAIRNICDIQISIEDNLPKHICADCLNVLKTAVKFRSLCRKTDSKLRTTLDTGNTSRQSFNCKYDFNLLLHKIYLKRQKNKETMQQKRNKLHEFGNKRLKMKHFKCSPCQLEFNTQDDLKSHKQLKQCLKTTCEICGEQVLDVNQHNDFIHRCDTCGKKFPLLSRLKSHMLVHSNEFRFFCDLCPYKSKQKHNLVLHMRTHTGEKPYTCEECSLTFVNQSNYSKHMKRHGDIRYMCPTCNKSFIMINDCREHYNAVHLNIKHNCEECGRKFSYRNDLRKHQVRVHNFAKKNYKGGQPSYLQYQSKRYKEQSSVVEQDMSHVTETVDQVSHQSLDQMTQSPVDQVPQQLVDQLTQPVDRVTHQPVPVVPIHGSYGMTNGKNYVYYAEVPVFHSANNVATSQQAIHILPELPIQALKKDNNKMYEQPEVNYFIDQ